MVFKLYAKRERVWRIKAMNKFVISPIYDKEKAVYPSFLE